MLAEIPYNYPAISQVVIFSIVAGLFLSLFYYLSKYVSFAFTGISMYFAWLTNFVDDDIKEHVNSTMGFDYALIAPLISPFLVLVFFGVGIFFHIHLKSKLTNESK